MVMMVVAMTHDPIAACPVAMAVPIAVIMPAHNHRCRCNDNRTRCTDTDVNVSMCGICNVNHAHSKGSCQDCEQS